MPSRATPLRWSVALLGSMAVLGASSCGGGTSGTGDGQDDGPTIAVGATDATESVLVAALYAEELDDVGYEVDRRFYLPPGDVLRGLQKGTIDVAPQFLGIGSGLGTDPGGTEARSQRALQAELTEGLVALEPSEAGTTYAFVVTRRTAHEAGLERVSDLVGREDLVLGGPEDCSRRPTCLPGLQSTYGVDLSARFVPLDAGGPRTKAALADGRIDVALLSSTDGAISVRGWVVLEDDRDLQPSGRTVPVVREDVLDDEVRSALEQASESLTPEALRDLIRRASVEQQDPEDAVIARRETARRGGP